MDSDAAQAAMKLQQKYEEERQKRLRPDGDAQYIDLVTSEKFREFLDDPWLDERSNTVTITDGEHVKFLILGAGWGGLVHAAKLVKAGIPPDEIRIVDSAGGFGGTWYWNRYPGLMCDVESYSYLPLLEDTGYVPKHKYSYGPEIREYANLIAEKYGQASTAMFRTQINTLVWDERESHWRVTLTKLRSPKAEPLVLNITAQFVIATSGLLLHPKLPAVEGIERFKGDTFHTSRWAYDVTGGSPTDPTLTKLAGKRVGIIGTGATAIQCVPHLAEHARHLTVFQRTPSSVDSRGQHPTSPQEWESSVATGPGWWKRRNLNMARHVSDTVPQSEVNLVNDQWSNCHSYHGLVGGKVPPSMEEVPQYVGALFAMDAPRAERLRARVDTIVKDPKTANSLKHWYGSWCKRPTFHDDYLPVFNRSNVQLVDTDGKGVASLTETGAVVDGVEYPLDILIFSTGFRAPAIGSPGFRAGMKITGRNGRDMDAKWDEGVATLHGCMTHDFPNLLIPGPLQAGATANQNFTHDIMSNHNVQIVVQAQARYPSHKVVVEPTRAAEETWSGEILKRGLAFAGAATCTPGYLNGEGVMARLGPQEMAKVSRMTIWGEGIESFMNVLEAWEKNGKLEGLEVRPVLVN